jgi:hypothetical protein
MSYFPQQSNRLQPAETFLDSLPLPLADEVADMTRRPLVKGTPATPTVILGHVRCHLHVAALGDEVGRVITFVPTHRHPLGTGSCPMDECNSGDHDRSSLVKPLFRLTKPRFRRRKYRPSGRSLTHPAYKTSMFCSISTPTQCRWVEGFHCQDQTGNDNAIGSATFLGILILGTIPGDHSVRLQQ